MDDYKKFLEDKQVKRKSYGFETVFIPDCLFPFQKCLTTWAVSQGRLALFEDCVAGETIVETEHGPTRIDSIYTSMRVWSRNRNGTPVLVPASASWVNGYGDIYELRFISGRVLRATMNHRLLSSHGWKYVSEVQLGDRFLSYDVSHLRRSLAFCRSTRGVSDHHWSGTVGDYQSNYFVCSCQYDVRLLLDQDVCRCVFPSQDDVHEHIRHQLHEDDLGSELVCNRRCRSAYHLATGRFARQVGTILEDEVFRLPSYEYTLLGVSSDICLLVLEGTNLVQQVPEFHPLGELESEVFQYEPSCFSYDTLAAVHYIRTDVFYDIEVPGLENYFANGFVSHNCGLGKTVQSLVWAENVVRKTNKKVLILTPLAVSHQFVKEAEKFGLQVNRTQNGKATKGINVTNYERLDKFNCNDFVGVVADESSRIKHFDSAGRKQITEFMSKVEYRLLATATPAPNDFMELGCSSEALGCMSRNQMLAMFFTNDGESTQQWRLKGHAKKRFWQWVATWARACRKPSDLGFPDDGFILPELRIHSHVLPSNKKSKGFFPDLAKTLEEQREERKRTYKQRCEKVASLVPSKRSCLIYCHLNKESELLTKLIPDAVEVTGSDKDEVKEERLLAFQSGEITVLVTKVKIAGFGLNLQHADWVSFFPSWSYESYYQGVRRLWRYGQKNPVDCHIVSTEREKLVLDGMLRKERQSSELFSGIVREMNSVVQSEERPKTIPMRLPSWLKNGK